MDAGMPIWVEILSGIRDAHAVVMWIVLVVSVAYLWFGLDDLIVDLYAWVRQLKPRRLTGEHIGEIRAMPEKRVAVIVPAWKESNVIRRMLLGNLAAIEYQNVDFFVGVYPNDPDTLTEVQAAAASSDVVFPVVGDAPGPTSKGQILNCVVRAIAEKGQREARPYAALLMQDSEDVMHPLALKLLNYELDRADFVQMPVFSLQVKHSKIVAGTYMDEFAESHTKDLLVRAAMGAGVPSAGVSTGLSWRLVEAMRARDGGLFNEGSLTEDYELGLRAHEHGMRPTFSCAFLGTGKHRDFIATREFFPSKFRRSVRQKTRWTTGIALQGWRNLGWSRSFVESYWRYRDRKSLLTNPLSFVGYWCATWMVLSQSQGWPTTVDGGAWEFDVTPLLFANLAFMVNRYFQRCICTGRVYGVGFVPLVLVRWPVAIVINGLACLKSLSNDVQATLLKRAHRWEKTEHELPQEFGLTARAVSDS